MSNKKVETKKGVKCLSFQEPFATMIMTGVKTVECRSRRINTPIKDLVVCSSKTPRFFQPIDGLTYGYAIGMVDVVDCVSFRPKHIDAAMMTGMPSPSDYAWILENPRMIVPRPVKGLASFFYADFSPKVVKMSRKSYEKNILPVAHRGEDDELRDAVLHYFFEEPEGLMEFFFG